MAEALVENKISAHQSISSDTIRKDLAEISGIKDPVVQTDIIKNIRLNPQVETETVGGTYDFKTTHDWTHYIKKKQQQQQQ